MSEFRPPSQYDPLSNLDPQSALEKNLKLAYSWVEISYTDSKKRIRE